jgi:hypothetical protein
MLRLRVIQEALVSVVLCYSRAFARKASIAFALGNEAQLTRLFAKITFR